MLGNNAAFPSPKPPASIIKRTDTGREQSTGKVGNPINEVTCTIVEAR